MGFVPPFSARTFGDKVDTALNGLAVGPIQVLRHYGIKGKRSSCDCPVQRYLTRIVPPPKGARWVVSRSGVLMVSGRNIVVEVPLPRAVSQFVKEFDQGRYPYLRDEVTS